LRSLRFQSGPAISPSVKFDVSRAACARADHRLLEVGPPHPHVFLLPPAVLLGAERRVSEVPPQRLDDIDHA